MRAEEFIEATGGIVTPADLPPSLRDGVTVILERVLAVSRAMLGAHDRDLGIRTRLEVVASPFFTCRAKDLGGGEYLLVVPAGLVCRFFVLAHLLSGYLPLPRVYVPGWRGPHWRVPPGLTPLFGPAQPAQPWWTGLEKLCGEVRSAETAVEATPLTALALTFAIGHETAHIVRRHGEAAACLRRRGVVRDRTDETAYRRFAEIDADVFASSWSIDVQRLMLTAAGQEDDPRIAYMRLSYAVTMLHALYDAHRRGLGLYASGAYPHPIARRHFFTVVGSRTDREHWAEAETLGWLACAAGLQRLNLDVLRGRFGAGADSVPVSDLQYNVTEAPRVEDAYQRELLLHRMIGTVHHGAVTRAHPGTDFTLPPDTEITRLLATDDGMLTAALAMHRRARDDR